MICNPSLMEMKTMTNMYAAHLVSRYLKEVENIDTIFALSGGHIDLILDGCLEHDIRVIDVRHEQSAAMMAHAWSIYRKQPGVCLVTAGPGFTNSLTGLVNAAQENAPLVCISGCVKVKDWGRGALQELNQGDMVKSVVKWHDVCHDPARIPEYLATAFRHAVSGRPGPVLLEIPPDVLDVKVDVTDLPREKKGSIRYTPEPNPECIHAAAELIQNAQRPFLIGGSGVAFSDCREKLSEFIEKTGIPFILMGAGRGTLPDTHPLSTWDGGLVGISVALGQADLVIGLGLRFNWLLNFGQGFPEAKVIRVDIDATELDRNRHSDVGLVGDIRLVLKQLNQRINQKTNADWPQSLRQTYISYIQDEITKRERPSKPIHPVRLMAETYEATGDDAVYIIDGGDTCYFGTVGTFAAETAGVLSVSGGQFGCLGTGIPFGLAAKAAMPEKSVVVITGDGSFGFNAMEFDTAVRHNLPIVCIVNNDKAWGMIKHGQEVKYGPDRLVASELGLVRYEEIVKSLGGYGELVENDEDIQPAITRALKSGKPACINVMTDPTAISLATYQFVSSFKKE